MASDKEDGEQVDNKELYSCPSVVNPTTEQLTDIATRLGFHMDDVELKAYQMMIKGNIDAMNSIEHLVEPTLTTKYPRLPGQTPSKADNSYNAWARRCEIRGADRGRLTGKRIAIKDSIAIACMPMMNGSHALEGFTPSYDATVVSRVLDAGGVIVGKTVCEDMCFSACSSTAAQGPVLNPHDTTRSAGGSSSGNAVVLAIGEADMALGSDQGGSLRVPASWTGVVGLKPTYGLVPYTGAIEGDPAIDHIGPMARTVEDCALLLEVIAGYDRGFDQRQHPDTTVPQYTKQLVGASIKGLKIGLVEEGFGMPGAEEAVNQLVETTVRNMESLGAIVERISVPMHSRAKDIYGTLAEGTGAYMQRPAGCVGAGFYPSSLVTEFGKLFHSRPDDFPLTMKMVLMQSEYLSRNYKNQVHARGRNLVFGLRQAYDHALEKVDVLALPTTPYRTDKLMYRDDTLSEFLGKCFGMTTNTAAFNLSGHPALSVNAGFLEGLPVGLMLVGRHFDELTIFKVAQAVEKIRDETK
ncbi:uncharacterized protein LOC576856 [Strongylocentrotus purpuratus]|uniref:Amidase domain-containing protein n=1 Tax=Strongylocentrotus purpuratus TaxID=7668 RepID=A0A7M7MYF7_STRPU|nr:uncharacterized protein LOC576856 [Strongylocentrotus purpuratus]